MALALIPTTATITLLETVNPKRGASAARYDLYKKSATVADYLSKGGTRADLAWDSARGYIKIQGVAATAPAKKAVAKPVAKKATAPAKKTAAKPAAKKAATAKPTAKPAAKKAGEVGFLAAATAKPVGVAAQRAARTPSKAVVTKGGVQAAL